jgi:hypothetical protein
MSPSEQCKSIGLKSLMQVSRVTGVSPETLINWHKSKKKAQLFNVVLIGCLEVIKNDKSV